MIHKGERGQSCPKKVHIVYEWSLGIIICCPFYILSYILPGQWAQGDNRGNFFAKIHIKSPKNVGSEIGNLNLYGALLVSNRLLNLLWLWRHF